MCVNLVTATETRRAVKSAVLGSWLIQALRTAENEGKGEVRFC